MRVVRSPYAHAVLRAIDAAAALAAPGVVAVWTEADIADLPPIDFRDPAGEALRPYRQPLLARDRLRYVGEPVAAVFATDPYLAEDAADLVTIEAEELPPVLDAAAAPGSFAAGLSTEALVLRDGYGDVDAAFRARPMRSSRSTSRSAATPACRWRRAARSRITTRRATCWSCTAPPRCRTATAMRSRACSAAAPPRWC